MLLKSLEMQGFKSFPDALRIDFHAGLTAIVGPNGSGKSNISDAIRWVLGEQSTKTLRGSKMEDVIFAGTEERRRMGMAEVTLTLDNSDHKLHTDYDEVAVTRRFFRSGESEYYINKKAVRLRDIHELFMDTGIGRDGYSVIGQGRIDEILSVRAQDRRDIFDEAAGITKFRYRRDEAERKLEAAEENLVRVTDLVGEMETQLPGLEKQAEKERRYNALRAEQQTLEVALWLRQLDAADAELAKAEADLAAVQASLDDSAAQAEALETEAAELTAQMRALEEAQEKARLEIQECISGAAAEESRIALAKAAMERNRTEAQAREQDAGEAQAREEALAAQLAGMDEQSAAQETAVIAAEDAHAKAAQHTDEARAAVEDLRGQAETLRQETDALRTQESGEREQEAGAQALASALRAQLDALAAASKTRDEARAAAAEALSQREREEKAAAALVTEKENVLAGLSRLRASRTERETQARDALTKLRIRQSDTENRLRLLEELARDYEGYAKAVRAVMSRKNSLGGIHGPVSALIRADDAYVAAIETALGAAAGNIVVDTEEDARRAIGMLKSRDEGRATFLPLSVIRGSELDAREWQCLPGVEGLASRLVRSDARYAAVVRNLLGRTVVIDTIEHAIAAAKASGHRLRLVTLDGQVLSPGGAMTGGSLARSSGAMTRANELERLKKDRESIAEALKKAQNDESEAARESAALELRTETAQADAAQARDAHTACTVAAARAREALAALEKDEDEARAELEAKLDAVTARWETHRSARGVVQRKLDDAAAAAVRLSEAQEDADAALQAAQAAQETARAQLEEARAALREARASRASLAAQLDTAREDARRRAENVRDYEAENRTLAAEAEAAEQSRAAFAQRQQEAQEKLSDILQQKTGIEARRVEGDRKRSEAGQRQIALEREKLRLENRAENLRRTQDSLTASLWDEYGLTRGTAREQAQPLEHPDAAKKRADALRREIRALGSVYTGAIEEYTKLRERYDFYCAQKTDAETSREKLTGVIAELNREMRRQFTEQFAVINRAFGETFREIFGGGNAALELEDASEVLTSGIEIRVQIPGKTMKVLSLLSGGERAFVAIALYFAILRVRPTPFCILDEIDAALDDVNVQHFARYLRQYTEKTQFIVITHRRHTMEEADMLYGVAMPVQGISKLVALDVAKAVRELGIS